MTSDVPAVAQAFPNPPARPSRRWIQSPSFDLTFFILAPVTTLPIVLGILAGFTRLAHVGFLLAFAHYLSTFAFYFWDENQLRHRSRWAAFFAGPLVIVVLFWLLVAFRVPLVIPFLLFVWNTYHVGIQSCGILSIYRHRAGVSDPRQKTLANSAILAVSAWLALWNIETHQQVYPVLTALGASVPSLLRLGLGLYALFALVRLGEGLRRRAATGSGPTFGEMGILLTGLTLFHPYLWTGDSESATFVMLLPHYVQYLGLVWLLHRRKFPRAEGSPPQRLLHFLSHNLLFLGAALLSGGLAFLAGKILFRSVGQVQYFEAIYLLLAFVHFYLDGLFWAFKDPHVRSSMGPYLLRGSAGEMALAGAR